MRRESDIPTAAKAHTKYTFVAYLTILSTTSLSHDQVLSTCVQKRPRAWSHKDMEVIFWNGQIRTPCASFILV